MRSRGIGFGARPGWLAEGLCDGEGNGIRVGVIDSGWDWSVEDDRIEPGIGFVSEHDDFVVGRSADTQDRIGHGTMCADLILSVAPRVTITPIRVFGCRLETSVETLAAAIEYGAEQNLHILNVSLSTMRADAIRLLYLACERSVRRGMIIVAAAFGHSNLDGGPAAYAPAIGVGVGDFALPMQFEYRPDEAIECVASAASRFARGLGGHAHAVTRATSFATPTITGILSLLRERFPRATCDELRAHLQRLAPLSFEACRGAS